MTEGSTHAAGVLFALAKLASSNAASGKSICQSNAVDISFP